ncbi:MAG: response regulator [Chloroflexi bacterium]|nr:response regulator [Chloroflexota bacterium]
MPKILIIDDDTQLCAALRVRLEKQNYDVLTASNGADGLDLAKQESPQLIVLDLAMPDIDGLQILGYLKHQATTSDIPVLVVTARGQIGDHERAMLMGATRFLLKPLSLYDFVFEISHLLATTSPTS